MNDATNAERQARHRAKLRKQRAALEAELRVLRNTGAAADMARLKAENAALKAEIAKLKTEGRKAAKPVTKPADPDSEVARFKATIVEQRRALRYFQKRPDGKVDSRTFTIMQSRFHPDRVSDPEQKARYRIVFEALGERRNSLVDEDQARIANEIDMFLGKKAETKKRKPAAPAKPPRKLPVT